MIFLKPISKGNFRLPLLVDTEEKVFFDAPYCVVMTVLAVIACYSRCFVQMLPASRFPAHFTALFHMYFVSILLRLFIVLLVGLPRQYAEGTPSRFTTRCYSGLCTLPVFTKKVMSRQNVASHSL